MEAIIRKANIDDYIGINDLVKEVHSIHSKNRPKDYKEFDVPLKEEDFVNMINDDKVVIMVLENEMNELVGYSILKKIVINNHNIMCDKKKLHIDDLCISKKCRRKGLGRLLFNKIKEYAKEEGFDSIELNVWNFNQSAIKFYESLGMNIKMIRYETDL